MFSILSRGFLLLTIIIQKLNQTCIQLILKLASKHKTILVKTYRTMIFLIVVFINVNLVRSLLYVMYAKKQSPDASASISLSISPFLCILSSFQRVFSEKINCLLDYRILIRVSEKRKGRRSKLEIHRKRPN